MTAISESGAGVRVKPARGPLIYRQSVVTRITHWVWVICLFFLLLTGLQIFNAHPALYIGQQSGFAFENAILEIGAENTPEGIRGFTTVFGQKYDTTGVLGVSELNGRPNYVAFPGWSTIPSFRDLASGRVIHFFFGWIFLGTILLWFIWSAISGHLKRDILPSGRDLVAIPGDLADHVRFRFHHNRTYGPVQKLTYFIVFFILFPLIVLTGLTMSPGMNAAFSWMLDLFGGRQTARTIHFVAMALLVLFFIIHLVMVVLAGPFNELRSMITGWYRAAPGTPVTPRDRIDG
jgi:thiosulfate reductase cytochrome b subunit